MFNSLHTLVDIFTRMSTKHLLANVNNHGMYGMCQKKHLPLPFNNISLFRSRSVPNPFEVHAYFPSVLNPFLFISILRNLL